MLIVVGNECQPDQSCFLTFPLERLSLSKYTILIRATNCLISLTLIATKHVRVCLTAVQTNMKNGSFVVVLQIQLFKLIKSAFFWPVQIKGITTLSVSKRPNKKCQPRLNIRIICRYVRRSKTISLFVAKFYKTLHDNSECLLLCKMNVHSMAHDK